MPASPAQIVANRLNCLKSKGPSPQGRLRSRLNALKHGLTGQGVALPDEDTAEVQRRFGALADEFRPSTESGRMLIHRFAFLSVRLNRCERHEVALLSERVRHAIARFDDLQILRVEDLAHQLNSDPMTVSRRLQETPLGIDWLLGYWAELRADLMVEGKVVWTWNHMDRVEALLGNFWANLRVSRPRALSEAVYGFFGNLAPEDGAGLDDKARSLWARDQIAAIIDAEVARLEEVRESLDPEAIEQDRAEAPDRALFDASNELVLARKYEAATERAMYKALNEFRKVEAAASEAGHPVTTPEITDTCDELASFGSDPEPAPEISEPEAEEAAEPASRADLTPPTVEFPAPEGSFEAPKPPGFARDGAG